MSAVTIRGGRVDQEVPVNITRMTGTVLSGSLREVHTSSLAEDVSAADLAVDTLWRSLKRLSS